MEPEVSVLMTAEAELVCLQQEVELPGAELALPGAESVPPGAELALPEVESGLHVPAAELASYTLVVVPLQSVGVELPFFRVVAVVVCHVLAVVAPVVVVGQANVAVPLWGVAQGQDQTLVEAAAP